MSFGVPARKVQPWMLRFRDGWRGRERGPEGPRSMLRIEPWTQKSMSPPGMPPAGMAGAFSGFSATTASVVRNKAAIEAAF